jgi:hypothetical protein
MFGALNGAWTDVEVLRERLQWKAHSRLFRAARTWNVKRDPVDKSLGKHEGFCLEGHAQKKIRNQ